VKKIYVITRVYKPLYLAFEKKSWAHTGSPAYYNFIKYLEKDNRFDSEVFFLLDKDSSKKLKSSKLHIEGIQKKVNIVNYISLKSSNRVIMKAEWVINKIYQYSFLFLKLKKNSIYYIDRDNILLGNILNLKNGLIIYRLLGVTKKIYDILFVKKGLLTKLFLRALTLKDKIIISSNDGSWAEPTKQNLCDENFHLLFNGTNLKKDYHIPILKNNLQIVYISRLEAGKGHFEFLKILSLLKKKNINSKTTIIGGGTLAKQLVNEVSNLQLNNNVMFTGNIEHNMIEKYLKQADLFISLNFYGIFGNNVIEATSKGIPIIALNNNNVSENYKKYFYIVKNDDFKETIEFIEEFSNNLDLRRKYSKMSTEFFDKYIFTWNERIKKELDLINNEYEKKIGSVQ